MRITHIPTGLVSESRAHKEQPRNKKEAFMKLCQKIKEWHEEKIHKEKIRNTEVIRTYHGVDNRVKDHASGFIQSYNNVMNDISDMMEARFLAMMK